MRTLRPRLKVVFLAGAVLACATGDVAAMCSGIATESFLGYAIVLSPGQNTPASIESVFWALGFGNAAVGAGDDSGDWADTEATPEWPAGWLHAFGAGSYLAGSWSSSGGVDGCIRGLIAPFKSQEIMVAAFSDEDASEQVGYFAVAATARRVSSPEYGFTFGTRNVNLVPIPRPVLQSVSRVDPTHLAVTVQSPTLASLADGVVTDGSAAAAELVVGYRLYWRDTTPEDPPVGRWREAPWVPASSVVPLGQTAQATIACGCPHAILAQSLVFESGFETAYLSQDSTRLLCSNCTVWIDFDNDGYTPEVCCAGGFPDCNDADPDVHPNAPELCDGVDNDCDGLVDEDPSGADTDGDGVRNACDVCPEVYDPAQHDRDRDRIGDACDLDDGVIELGFAGPATVTWQQEGIWETWNLYRGDLAVLRSAGLYTQEPGSNPLAERTCNLPAPSWSDAVAPAHGSVAIYMVTGVFQGFESCLGPDSLGNPRPNTHPCP
jgi:hypothetical protein